MTAHSRATGLPDLAGDQPSYLERMLGLSRAHKPAHGHGHYHADRGPIFAATDYRGYTLTRAVVRWLVDAYKTHTKATLRKLNWF
jgi:hypothetical protein